MAALDDDDGPEGDKKMPLMEHLIELRQRLIYSIVAFLLCFVVAYFFSQYIFDFLVEPLKKVYEGQTGRRMIFTAPTEAFFTYLRVAFFTAVFVAFPIIASQVWLFVVGPLVGGAIAGYTYRLLFGDVRRPVASGAFAPPGSVPGYGAPDQYQQQWNEPVTTAASAQPHSQEWGQPQWTPEQLAAWEAQQAHARSQAQPSQQQPTQEPPAQQWTPEQIAAWRAQQAQSHQGQQPGQQSGQQSGWPDDEGDAERTQIRPPR